MAGRIVGQRREPNAGAEGLEVVGEDRAVAWQPVLGPPPTALLGDGEARRRAAERPYVLTLIVYERERRALGSLLALSARGTASSSFLPPP